MSRKKTGCTYECMLCAYKAPRYLVRQHHLDKHQSLAEVPYICAPCGRRFGARERAEAHLPAHGMTFRETFTGTYVDGTQDPPMRRLDAMAVGRRSADRTEELRRLLSPRQEDGTTYVRKRAREDSADLVPPLQIQRRNGELVALTPPPSAPSCPPSVSEEPRGAVSTCTTPGQSEDAVDLAPGGSIDPPLLDVLETLAGEMRGLSTVLAKLVSQQADALSYMRRTAHAVESLRPPQPPRVPVHRKGHR